MTMKPPSSRLACSFAAALLLCATAAASGQTATSPSVTTALASSAELRVETLSSRASAGDAQAQYELGRKYADGNGVPMDRPRALMLYTASARQEFAKAEYEVANHYGGRTGQALDLRESFKYLERAATHGHLPAQVDIGFIYLNGNSLTPKDPAKSYPWFRRAANNGSVIAQCMLGDFHRLGLGGVAKDAREAYKWYRRTATRSDRCAAKSQYELYASHMSGQGARKDMATAMVWLRRSADADNPQAQRTLGRAYESGTGVPRDPVLARMWLRKSREGVAPHDDHAHEDEPPSGQAHRGHAH